MLLFDSLLSLIAPHRCLVCDREGELVCAWCRPDFAEAVPSRCYRCLSRTDYFTVCKRCRPQTRLRQVWVSTTYDNRPKELIHRLKFERAQAAAKLIAGFMHETVPYLPPETILVPVPTASSRVRQRGYDQSLLIARELGKLRQLKTVPALRRFGQHRQVGTSRRQRLQQLQGAFRMRPSVNIQSASILLVDDVVTTGATLEAAATVLKRAGAIHLNAAAFAHTPPSLN